MKLTPFSDEETVPIGVTREVGLFQAPFTSKAKMDLLTPYVQYYITIDPTPDVCHPLGGVGVSGTLTDTLAALPRWPAKNKRSDHQRHLPRANHRGLLG